MNDLGDRAAYRLHLMELTDQLCRASARLCAEGERLALDSHALVLEARRTCRTAALPPRAVPPPDDPPRWEPRLAA